MRRSMRTVNDFVSRYPALAVGFISLLVSAFGAVTVALVSLGYSHTAEAFDRIEAEALRNREQHIEIRRDMTTAHDALRDTQSEHGERLIRIETLANGGAD